MGWSPSPSGSSASATGVGNAFWDSYSNTLVLHKLGYVLLELCEAALALCHVLPQDVEPLSLSRSIWRSLIWLMPEVKRAILADLVSLTRSEVWISDTRSRNQDRVAHARLGRGDLLHRRPQEVCGLAGLGGLGLLRHLVLRWLAALARFPVRLYPGPAGLPRFAAAFVALASTGFPNARCRKRTSTIPERPPCSTCSALSTAIPWHCGVDERAVDERGGLLRAPFMQG